jgi:hypothetical protein
LRHRIALLGSEIQGIEGRLLVALPVELKALLQCLLRRRKRIGVDALRVERESVSGEADRRDNRYPE